MRRKIKLFISLGILSTLCACATMQSIVKSTFPYTTTVMIRENSDIGVELSAMGKATSFDQDFKKNGNNGAKVSEVSIVSAKLMSTDPTDFDIGNLVSIKIFMSKPDGSQEVLVASRKNITRGVGNSMALDIDNSSFLDEHVRQPQIRIRVVYVLRNHIDVDAYLHLVLGLSAYPNE